MLSSCAPYNEPAPDHYTDQVSHHIFKLKYQDEMFLHYRGRLAEHYGVRVPNLLQEPWDANVLNVWWVDDQPCPYQPERNAIITCLDQDCPRRCLAGQMWGCAEIYVATNQRNPESAVGTALLHEYGHCLRDLFLSGPDGSHSDTEFWELTQEINSTLSERYRE